MGPTDDRVLYEATYDRLMGELEDRLGATWADLEARAREDVEASAGRLTELYLRVTLGEQDDADLAHEIEVEKATLANWAWVGSSMVATFLLESLGAIMAAASEVGVAFLKGLI